MSIKNCYNYKDFRNLAKKKLPSPIFHYIDGGADDEITLNRNMILMGCKNLNELNNQKPI